jgi:dynein heavy chain
LELEMLKTVKKVVKVALEEYDAGAEKEDFKRPDWVLQHPAQAICTASSIVWCRTTEFMLKDENVEESMIWWSDENITQLEALTGLVRQDLNNVERAACCSLITQDVHYRDIIEELREASVDNIYDFNWQKQLRYYNEEEVQLK